MCTPSVDSSSVRPTLLRLLAFTSWALNSDLVAVTDIYSSGETPRPGVTGRIVADAVMAVDSDASVVWLPRLEDVATWLVDNLQPGDLCLTLGAGDLTTVPDAVIDRLAQQTGEIR